MGWVNINIPGLMMDVECCDILYKLEDMTVRVERSRPRLRFVRSAYPERMQSK